MSKYKHPIFDVSGCLVSRDTPFRLKRLQQSSLNGVSGCGHDPGFLCDIPGEFDFPGLCSALYANNMLMVWHDMVTSRHENTFHITGPLWWESVSGGHSHYDIIMWSFDAYFNVSLNKLPNKQPNCRAFEMPWGSYDVPIIYWCKAVSGHCENCKLDRLFSSKCLSLSMILHNLPLTLMGFYYHGCRITDGDRPEVRKLLLFYFYFFSTWS